MPERICSTDNKTMYPNTKRKTNHEITTLNKEKYSAREIAETKSAMPQLQKTEKTVPLIIDFFLYPRQTSI